MPDVSPAEAAAAKAATAGAPAALVEPAIVEDARFARMPMERLAMMLIVPSTTPGKRPARLMIREITSGGRVTIEEAESAFERSVDLNVRELRALAMHANTIARRVARRPEWKP